MRIAITDVRVFDGQRLLDPATVVIDGDRIGTDPAGAEVVDGVGGVLLPGLIDAHVHLRGSEDLERLVDGDPTADVRATRAIRRIWCAGVEVAAHGG
jgi:imidazolonepropionase-like amidohydrolase